MSGRWQDAKEHYQGFIEAAVGSEGSLPLVTLFYLDVVETSPNIQFYEVLGSTELGNQLGNEQKWVLVLHSHGVQNVVVLHQTEFAILLFNKEDWGGYRRFGWTNPTRIEIFLEKGILLLLLQGRKWVDLATFQRGIGDKFNCV